MFLLCIFSGSCGDVVCETEERGGVGWGGEEVERLRIADNGDQV